MSFLRGAPPHPIARAPDTEPHYHRFLAVAALHLSSYCANLLALIVLWQNVQLHDFFWIVLAAHVLCCVISICAAGLEARYHLDNLDSLLAYLLTPIAAILGGCTQLVHIWLAWEEIVVVPRRAGEIVAQLIGENGDSRRLLGSGPRFIRQTTPNSRRTGPPMVPQVAPCPRYHCRGVDAVFEGAVFFGVLLYVQLLPSSIICYAQRSVDISMNIRQCAALWICICLSFLSATLALMEVDHAANPDNVRRIKTKILRLIFRGSELASRLWLLALLILLGGKLLEDNGLVVGYSRISAFFAVLLSDYAATALLLICCDRCSEREERSPSNRPDADGNAWRKEEGRDLFSPLISLTSMLADVSRYVNSPTNASRVLTRCLAWKDNLELMIVLLLGVSVSTEPSANFASMFTTKALNKMLAPFTHLRYACCWVMIGGLVCVFFHRSASVLLFCRNRVVWRNTCRCCHNTGVDQLCKAAQQDDDQKLSALLKSLESAGTLSERVNSPGEAGLPALHIASREGSIRAMKVLLQFEADVSLKLACNETPLMIAAASGHDAAVWRLLNHNRDMNHNRGMKVLNWALSPSGNADAPLLDGNPEAGDTALHLAARAGHTACVHTLVRARADLHKKNQLGRSAADIASNRTTLGTLHDTLQNLQQNGHLETVSIRTDEQAITVEFTEDWAEQFQRAGMMLSPDGNKKILCCDKDKGKLRVHQFEDSRGPRFELNVDDIPPSNKFPLHLKAADEDATTPRLACRERSDSAASYKPPSDSSESFIPNRSGGAVPLLRLDERTREADPFYPITPSRTTTPDSESYAVNFFRTDAMTDLLRQAREVTAAATPSIRSAIATSYNSSAPSQSSTFRGATRTTIVNLTLQRTWRLPSVVALCSPGALRRLLANPSDLVVARPRKVTVLDDFRIVAVVGEGNFGIVYEALDLRCADGAPPRKCALKILHKKKYHANELVERARRERYVLKAARHPFVVRLYSAFRTPARELAFSMEYCPNGNLNDYIVRNGKPGLPLPFIRKILAEIVLALEHLHDDLDIMFRDLKPENVIFDAFLHAKLTDFGLVKLDVAADDCAISFVGTTRYVAPEIVPSGDQSYTSSVDLYALGVVAWVCFTGGLASERDGFSPILVEDVDSGNGEAYEIAHDTSIDFEIGVGAGRNRHNNEERIDELRLPPESHEELRAWLDEYQIGLTASGASDIRTRSGARGDAHASYQTIADGSSPARLPPAPSGLSPYAMALMDQLTSTSSEKRGTAKQLKDHPYFTIGTNPPLGNEQDWQALLAVATPREDGDAMSERSASSAGTWSWQT